MKEQNGAVGDEPVVAVGDVIRASVLVGRGTQRRTCVVEEVSEYQREGCPTLHFATGRFRTDAGHMSKQRRALIQPWEIVYSRPPRQRGREVSTSYEFTDRYGGGPGPDVATMCKGQCEGMGYVGSLSDSGGNGEWGQHELAALADRIAALLPPRETP